MPTAVVKAVSVHSSVLFTGGESTSLNIRLDFYDDKACVIKV